MSNEEAKAAKKRKRSSKGHESTKPRKKRSKADITDGQDAVTNPNDGALQLVREPDKSESYIHSSTIALPEKENWSISGPVGGRFLDAPPIFSQDERHLILAAPRAIHIYDCSSSLLIRELRLPEVATGTISAYALSSTSPNHIFAGTKTGFLALWDWTTGQVLRKWHTSSWICTIVPGTDNQSRHPIIYTHEVLDGGDGAVIKVHELHEDHGEIGFSECSSYKLLTLAGRARSFQVHLSGRIIVVALASGLFIGERQLMEKRSLEDIRYVWREMHVNSPITCFDIHVGSVPPAWNQDFNSREAPQFDIAIGTKDGQITIYEDIVNRLIFFENNSGRPERWLPRQLHWHRRPVGSVRWSRDGNYIISGGQEMTLCLWQLGGNRRSTLPYLMAAISQIVVSPSGAGYAIQLEDNSIMVLSTAELEAKTSIAGVQSYFLDQEVFEEAIQSKHDGGWWESLSHRLSTPAAIDPLRPSHILTAVSSSIVKTTNEPAAPYVQRFDISTNRHVHRQAITRNNATHMSESPDGTLLREPDVTHLQISSDGRWMATVEDWTPPPDDLEHIDFDWEALIEGLESRREVYLKFWRRSMDHHVWSLDTRIEAPHIRADGSPGQIFALVAEPKSQGFATIGEDGYVRIWKPKTRLSDGRFVRGAKGKRKGMVIWSCRHSIFLRRPEENIDEEANSVAQNDPPTACMAYSTDGSVLAVGQVLPGSQSHGQIYLIDPASGHLQRTIVGIWQSGLSGLGFLDQYLLVASNSLHVWDLVQNKLEYCLTLSHHTPSREARLAVNPHDKTFALALPPSGDDVGALLDSNVLILRPSDPAPVFSITIPNLVLALLPAQGSPGYVILDSAAEIRTVTPMAKSGIPMISQIAASEGELLKGGEAEEDEMDVDQPLEANGYSSEAELSREIDDTVEDEENDKPIVRPEQLAEVFDSGPSFALPPVRNLFESVVGLFARKTRAQPQP